MNNQQRFGSLSSSCFELHSFCSKGFSPQKGCNYQSDHDQLTLGLLSGAADGERLDCGSNGVGFLSPTEDEDDDNDENFGSGDTLQSLVQSCHRCGNRGNRWREKPRGPTNDDTQEWKHLPSQQNKSSSRNLIQSSLLSFEKNTDVGNFECSKVQQEKQLEFASSNVASDKEATRNKTRIRWTEELHKKFIDSVNRLGGAKKVSYRSTHGRSNRRKLRAARSKNGFANRGSFAAADGRPTSSIRTIRESKEVADED